MEELARVRPELDDPAAAIVAGEVLVDGRLVVNPRSLVPVGAAIVVRRPRALRGETKLRAALAAFGVEVHGVAVDVGAAAGGFTRVLLEAGAARVYAVDAGHGQLLGSLRADPRVIDLEGVNLADVEAPEPVEIVTIDVSYLALADAVPQLERLRFAHDAQLVALVKPQFELGLAALPEDPERAVPHACAGIERCPWRVRACMRSPLAGAHGAVEFLLWAERVSRDTTASTLSTG